MGKTTDLRRALNTNFLPLMEEKGFVVDKREGPTFMTFRKITPDKIFVCDIQWDKYGRPRFILNFGHAVLEDILKGGKDIILTDLVTSDMSVIGRIGPAKGLGWFRQDHNLFKRLLAGRDLAPANEIISLLMKRFLEVEHYWSTGQRSPELRLF